MALTPPDKENGQVWVKRDSPENSSMEHEDVTDSQTELLKNRIRTSPTGSVTPVIIALEPPAIASIPKWKRYVGVAILTFVNLLNYMDRFTIAGVLMEISNNFGINNAQSGLLQTVFIVSYMLVAPIFGYLGDRYNRIILMVLGMGLWSGFTLLSSFIEKPEHFTLFLLTRALVGIGEASYSTISPTLIGDMFVGTRRTQMLSLYFFATPIGSGLGYIVGSSVAKALGGWEWALRVTPIFGVIAILLLLCFCPNPPRGASETSQAGQDHSYKEDLIYLFKNKSFMWVTIGFTFMAFVIGSLTLWGPTYFAYSQIALGLLPPCLQDDCDYANISFIFGVITCVAGFSGVGIGAESARRWKLRGRQDADALVCAIGLFLGAPLLLLGVMLPQINLPVSWTLLFFADMCLCFTWTLISDMTLYVTEPNRRSTANAAQLLIGHLFGDAGSPYLLGVIADSLASGMPDSYASKYLSLQRAMFITLFVCILGAGGFLMASLNVVADKKKVDDYLKALSNTSSGTGSLELNSRTASVNQNGQSKLPNGNGPINQTADSPDGSLEEYDNLLSPQSLV